MAPSSPEPPDYRPPIDPGQQPMERSPAQAAREAALAEVSATLLNVEQAVRRADRAYRERLQATHKVLFRAAYFGGDQQRLM